MLLESMDFQLILTFQHFGTYVAYILIGTFVYAPDVIGQQRRKAKSVPKPTKREYNSTCHCMCLPLLTLYHIVCICGFFPLPEYASNAYDVSA